MSTRGLIGFVIDGQVKATYNHSDSYPSWLGVRVLFFARGIQGRLPRVTELARALKVVTDSDPVPNPLGYRLAETVDTNVGGSAVTLPRFPTFEQWTGNLTWYQALRGAQGDLLAYLDAGYMEDGASFAEDSLMCEWGYLVNLDNQSVEVYRGFQDQPHTDGRFANPDAKPADWAPRYKGEQFYYPIALVQSYPFKRLPMDDDFVATHEPKESE